MLVDCPVMHCSRSYSLVDHYNGYVCFVVVVVVVVVAVVVYLYDDHAYKKS